MAWVRTVLSSDEPGGSLERHEITGFEFASQHKDAHFIVEYSENCFAAVMVQMGEALLELLQVHDDARDEFVCTLVVTRAFQIE